MSSMNKERLLQLLSAELQSAESLFELLQQEHRLLISGEAEAIQNISARKHAQIKQLSEQLLTRDRFLKTLQLPRGKEGIELFIQLTEESGSIRRCWEQIQKLAAELRDRNEVNGGIVTLAQRHVRQALNLLTCHSENNTTYGRAGQQANRGPHSLAKV